MPNKNKNLKIGIVVGAIVVALIVLVVVLFGVSTNNSKDKTYTFNDARKATNRYAHFLIDGEKNDQSDIDKIDEYDRFTYLYNLLYLETYLYMEQNNMLYYRVFMVDCTGLTVDEEVNKIKEIIDRFI